MAEADLPYLRLRGRRECLPATGARWSRIFIRNRHITVSILISIIRVTSSL
jgi:hypothetical protein